MLKKVRRASASFMNKKRDIPTYIYEDKEVVLAYVDEVSNITPIAVESGIGVFPIEGFDFDSVTPCLTLDDAYSGYTDPEEICFSETINPENEDGVVLGWLRYSEAMRQKALLEIKGKPDSWFENLLVLNHQHNIFRVEVSHDGEVYFEEYINRTDYTADVAEVYEVGGGYCNCDTCVQYQDFEELTKEEFIEKWDEDIYDYVSAYSFEYAIIDDCRNADVYADDIREEIMQAINEINSDFFLK